MKVRPQRDHRVTFNLLNGTDYFEAHGGMPVCNNMPLTDSLLTTLATYWLGLL